MLGAVLLALGQVALVQIHAKADRDGAAAQARFQAQAAALLARIQPPTGFEPAPPTDSCAVTPLTRCFVTAVRPDQSLAAAYTSLHPLSYVAQRTDCGLTDIAKSAWTRQIKAWGVWRPCTSFGQAQAISLDVEAFPIPDHAHSTAGHPAFSGTTLSIVAIGPH